MSKRIHVQEIGKPEEKIIFIEFSGAFPHLVIDSVVDQFKAKGFDVMWGCSN